MMDIREQCEELLAEIEDDALPMVLRFLKEELEAEAGVTAYNRRAAQLYPEQYAAVEKARRDGTLKEYRESIGLSG